MFILQFCGVMMEEIISLEFLPLELESPKNLKWGDPQIFAQKKRLSDTWGGCIVQSIDARNAKIHLLSLAQTIGGGTKAQHPTLRGPSSRAGPELR